MGVVWCKRAWEVRGVEHGRVDGCLQVLSENGVSEEKLKRPLVLLVAAGCAERKAWFAVAKRERRAERGPRPFAAFQVIGMLGVEVEHLGSRAEAEAEAWDHRRALQPSTARGAGDKVPMTVGECELGALRDEVDVIRGQEAGGGKVVGREELQLLKEDGPLAPRPALGHGPAAKISGHRVFTPGLKGGKVRSREETGMRNA